MYSSSIRTAHLLIVSQHALGRRGVWVGVVVVYPSMQWGRHPPPVDRQIPVKT